MLGRPNILYFKTTPPPPSQKKTPCRWTGFSSDRVWLLSAAISAVTCSWMDLFKATYIWLVYFVRETLREPASYITRHVLSFCPFFSGGVTLKNILLLPKMKFKVLKN